MPENEQRLSLTFSAEVPQGMLGVRRARKPTGGTGSENWGWHHAFMLMKMAPCITWVKMASRQASRRDKEFKHG